MNPRIKALLAAFAATLIYAINHTLAKTVMPDYVGSFGFIFIRLSGAGLLFWLLSIFQRNAPIELKDRGRMVVAALLGMVINMLSFFKGLELSTPVNSAVMVTISPIATALLSIVLLGEPLNRNKISGILLGAVGAILLVVLSEESRQNAPNIPLGNALFVLNATSYGAYLVVAKQLIAKYPPVTLLRWFFTIALVISTPLTWSEFSVIDWWDMPLWVYGVILYVVLLTTFGTYILNAYAMTQLRASTVGAFIYLQPLLGIGFAILTGKDQITLINALAGGAILLGVYLASKPVSRKEAAKMA